ncbi:MAG: NAD(P)-dependent oxidoreductase [Candidatus Pacearchaeota archaeon]
MKKLLVTGGAGFLGYHICNQLSKQFKEVIVVDIAEAEKKEYPKNTKFYVLDITNKQKLDEVIKKEKPELVVHAAAALPLYTKKRIYQVNVSGTKNVLQSSLENKVERVVHISSTAVYGVPKKHPIYETDKLVGVGPYGETKIIAEHLCNQYRKKGLLVPIIRPKTFIGTGRLGVFQILYDWVEFGARIPIVGNGKNHYQLLDVEDLVNAIYLALVSNAKLSDDAFNVGAGEFHTVYEDVSELCNYAKSGAKVIRTPAKAIKLALMIFEAMKLSPLYKWVYGTADTDSFVSTEKIQNQLKWHPKYSNSQALIKSYQWYLDNKDNLGGTGVTHRVAWSQGILGIFKKMSRIF